MAMHDLTAGTDRSLNPQAAQGRYGVLFLVCLLSMITYLDRVCFGVAAPSIARDLSLSSVEQLRGAFTAFAIAYAMFEVPTGWLGDRYGPRNTLIRIVLWWSACTAATGLVGLPIGSFVLGGLGTMIALRFFFGAGEAGAYPNITRAIHNWFTPDQWAMAQGWIWMTGRLMGGLTPLIWMLLVHGTSWSSAVLSWRSAFWLFGLIGILWCVVFAMRFRNRPADSQNKESNFESHDGLSWRALVRSKNLWTLCIMYFCVNYGWYFHVTYLVGYMQQRYQLDQQSLLTPIYQGGPLWVGAVGCLLGGYVSLWLSRRVGDRAIARKLLGTTSLAVCSLCWLLAGEANSPVAFFAITSAAAFFTDITLGSTWATCQDIGRKSPAVAAACMNTVGALGAAAAGWFTGSIVQWTIARYAAELSVPIDTISSSQRFSATMAGYQYVFWSYAAVYAIAAICWIVIQPKQPIEE